MESCQQGAENVVGPIAGGKDLSARFDLGDNPFGLKKIDKLIGSQGGQGRMEKRPLAAKGLDESAHIQGVREIAARPAGHKDLGAGACFLFQQQGPPPALGRAAGRHQAGRTPANNDDFPISHGLSIANTAVGLGTTDYNQPTELEHQ